MQTLGVKRLIEQEAYKLWMEEGKPIGKDTYFWSKAERTIWKQLTDCKDTKVKLKDVILDGIANDEHEKSVMRKKAYIEFECKLSAEQRVASVWCKDRIDFNLCQHCAFLSLLDYKELKEKRSN